VIGVETADLNCGEGQDLREDELAPVTTLLCNAARAGRDNAIAFLDQPVDGDRRAALETLVLDLGVEGVLPVDRLVAMQFQTMLSLRQDRIWAWSLRRNPSMYLSTIVFRLDTDALTSRDRSYLPQYDRRGTQDSSMAPPVCARPSAKLAPRPSSVRAPEGCQNSIPPAKRRIPEDEPRF